MKYFLFTVLLFCFFTSTIQAQSFFGKTITLGTSFAPVPYSDFDEPIHYWEFSWSKSAAVQVAKYVDIGLNYINIYGHAPLRNSNRNTQQYNVGAFAQFVPFRAEKYALKVELSYSIGNYCTCGDTPFKIEERLQYAGLALIGEWRIKGRLYVDIALNLNKIMNRNMDDTYGYNTGSVGLNYVLGKIN